jgi:hypothetical protein
MTHTVRRARAADEEAARAIIDEYNDAVEVSAREIGYDAIYLDSKEGLDDAVRLYRRRGYVEVPRYNDNPDAIIFMRRTLT